MASCNFSIPLSGDPDALLARAKSAVQKQGGNFEGDKDRGQFNLSVFGNTIAGSYTVTGNQMDIIIEEKPFLIPCSTIEGFLKNQLGA